MAKKLPEVDLGAEQIHAVPECCQICGAAVALEEKSRVDTVRGEWVRRFDIEPPARVRVRWLAWECLADPGHYSDEIRP